MKLFEVEPQIISNPNYVRHSINHFIPTISAANKSVENIIGENIWKGISDFKSFIQWTLCKYLGKYKTFSSVHRMNMDVKNRILFLSVFGYNFKYKKLCSNPF